MALASNTPILTMEAANIFCGVNQPNDISNSNHLRISDVKLPGWDEQYVDHRATGAPVAIEIDTIFQRLQCDFTLVGWSSQVATLIAQWGSSVNQYWVFGALRDRVTGNVLQGVASIYGRLGRADPQMWRRGDLATWAYSIRGISKYSLTITEDQVPMMEWDYYNNIFNVGGNSVVTAINSALNIA